MLLSNTLNPLCANKWTLAYLKCYLWLICFPIMFNIFIYKHDLALNNLQGLIWHKTKLERYHFTTWVTQITIISTYNFTLMIFCPVGWDCRINWLHLCRGVRTPPPTCVLLWHKTGEAPVVLELWGNAEYPFIAIAPRSTLVRSGSTW